MRPAEDAVRRRAFDIMRRAMPDLVEEQRSLTPIVTGDLRDSVSADDPQLSDRSVLSVLRATAPHAGFYAFGTRGHTISSHGAYPLRNRRTGAVFGRTVQHPGTQPHPEWWSDSALRGRFAAALARAGA